ncbi:venom protease-like [Tribolium madens]|uniref:venom protease-like n=1 Tax=Tribolium madens TaxID=41895 RepID=UPI001CF743B6|nr:venom protease-like [Tribolium madens]
MLWIFLLNVAFFAVLPVNAQVSEGVPCETPDEEYGVCINIYNCTQLINLLVAQQNNPQVRNFLKSSTCGFINTVPLVCCPQPKTTSAPLISTPKPTPTPVVTDKSNTITTLPQQPHCGLSNHSNTRVVNGQPAKLGEFPWLVALGYRNSKNPNVPKWLCGGSLITEKHILTAAHCVHNQPTLYTARLGDLDLYSDDDKAHPETIPLVKAVIHENYSPVNFTNDIAILTLERSPRESTASPICLPFDEPVRSRNLVGTYPTVAGWGSLYFRGPSSPTLQETMLPVMDNGLCSRAYGTKSVIDKRVLCVGFPQGGKDACQGDSGGPLMHRQPDGDFIRMYQIGIVSYGLRCAEAGYPGVYTRVTAFLDWIQKNLN